MLGKTNIAILNVVVTPNFSKISVFPLYKSLRIAISSRFKQKKDGEIPIYTRSVFCQLLSLSLALSLSWESTRLYRQS